MDRCGGWQTLQRSNRISILVHVLFYVYELEVKLPHLVVHGEDLNLSLDESHTNIAEYELLALVEHLLLDRFGHAFVLGKRDFVLFDELSEGVLFL